MNLSWNPSLRRFEVQFQDFGEEQPLVKASGFKTDGPPNWVWYSIKSEPLTALREKRRPTVLTIDSAAKTEYLALKKIEDLNASTKALIKEQKKALKKKLENDRQDKLKPGEYFDPVLQCTFLIVEPKPFVSEKNPYAPPPPPETTCFICDTPVHSYEYGEGQPPACMWCSKIVLDKSEEVC
jgi:hypothetical protein